MKNSTLQYTLETQRGLRFALSSALPKGVVSSRNSDNVFS